MEDNVSVKNSWDLQLAPENEFAEGWQGNQSAPTRSSADARSGSFSARIAIADPGFGGSGLFRNSIDHGGLAYIDAEGSAGHRRPHAAQQSRAGIPREHKESGQAEQQGPKKQTYDEGDYYGCQ